MKIKIKKSIIERLLPGLVALLIFILLKILGINSCVLHRFDLILSSLVTVGITIIGFILTIITIFITIIDSKTMRMIKDNDKTELLTNYLISPIIASFILVVFCFYLFLYIDTDLRLNGINFYVLVVIVAYEIVSILRLLLIMAQVLRLLTEEKDSEGKEMKKAKGSDAFVK